VEHWVDGPPTHGSEHLATRNEIDSVVMPLRSLEASNESMVVE
jgi:hypothetical protein